MIEILYQWTLGFNEEDEFGCFSYSYPNLPAELQHFVDDPDRRCQRLYVNEDETTEPCNGSMGWSWTADDDTYWKAAFLHNDTVICEDCACDIEPPEWMTR